MSPALVRTALLCASLPLAAAAAAAGAAPELKTTPFEMKLADGSALLAERGTFLVPEDRNDPRSRRIELAFVRFKSTNPRPGSPIIYLAGGPGGSALGAARSERQPIFLALRAVGDVIAFEQRGVGASNHVAPCTATSRLDASVPLTEISLAGYYRQSFDHCVGKWRAAGVAVRGYTTEQSADDLEALRRALGARKIDLWGISYGSHLAMAAMRRHPQAIGRVVLASAEGMNQTVSLPSQVDPVFSRIERAAQLPAGQLTGTMRRVHARFDAKPQTFSVKDPNGSNISFRTDSFPIRMMAGIVAKNPSGIAQLVGAYMTLDKGQVQPIAPLLYGHFVANPLKMSGMPELMDVASGVSDRRLRLLAQQAPASIIGTAGNFPMPHLRRALPGHELPDSFRKEIRSNIRVLLLSGDLDVRTTLEEQAEATAGLRNKHQIIFRNGGHDLFEAHPAVPKLMTDFFSGRSVSVKELTLPAPALKRPS